MRTHKPRKRGWRNPADPVDTASETPSSRSSAGKLGLCWLDKGAAMAPRELRRSRSVENDRDDAGAIANHGTLQLTNNTVPDGSGRDLYDRLPLTAHTERQIRLYG